jgi:GMP synthase-like glutamine amidotransferase
MTLIVDMNRRKGSLAAYEFVEPIASVAGECEVSHYTEVRGAGGYDRIILSGTPLMEVGYMGHPECFEWLRDCVRPVLGICAGMQAMAAAFGSAPVRCQEIGMTDVETVKDNPLFAGRFRAYSLHNFAVEAPSGFDVLARSEKCVQAIRHHERPLFGVMFHPEVRNPDIIRNFLKA